MFFKFKCLKRFFFFFFFGGMCIYGRSQTSKWLLWSPSDFNFSQCSGRPQIQTKMFKVSIVVALRLQFRSVLWSPSDFQSYYGRPQTWDPKMEPKWKWSRNDGGSLENNEKQWEYRISRRKPSPPVMFKFKCLKRIFFFFVFVFFGGMCILRSLSDFKVVIMVALRLRFQSGIVVAPQTKISVFLLWSPSDFDFSQDSGRPQIRTEIFKVSIMVALRLQFRCFYYGRPQTWDPEMEPKWKWSRNDGGSLENNEKQWEYRISRRKPSPPVMFFKFKCLKRILFFFLFFFFRWYVYYGHSQTSKWLLWSPSDFNFGQYYGRPQTSISVSMMVALRLQFQSVL